MFRWSTSSKPSPRQHQKPKQKSQFSQSTTEISTAKVLPPKKIQFSASTFDPVAAAVEASSSFNKNNKDNLNWLLSRKPFFSAQKTMSTPNLHEKTADKVFKVDGNLSSLPPVLTVSHLVREPRVHQTPLSIAPTLPARNRTHNYGNFSSDPILFEKLHTRLAQLPVNAEARKRLQMTTICVKRTLKLMQQVAWYSSDPFIISRIVPVNTNCFDHHEDLAEKDRLVVFVVAMDLVSTEQYVYAFYRLLTSYLGHLGLPTHLHGLLMLGSDFIELPFFPGSSTSSSSLATSVLVRIHLTVEWSSFNRVPPSQRQNALLHWLTVRRVQWFTKVMLKRGGGCFPALALMELLKDIRKRFTALLPLTPWKIAILSEHFTRNYVEGGNRGGGSNLERQNFFLQYFPLDVAFRRLFAAAAGDLFRHTFREGGNFVVLDPVSNNNINFGMPEEVRLELRGAFFVLNYLLKNWKVLNSTTSSDVSSSTFTPGASVVLGLVDVASNLPTNLQALLRCQ